MEDNKRHLLGRRAFAVFLFRRLKLPLFLFVLIWFLWYSQWWTSPAYGIWLDYAAKLLLLISLAYLTFIILRTYWEYRCYTYTFTAEAFMLASGYIVKNEIAALYHQIQNVNIRRSPLDRLVGVSQVVILMIGAERESHRAHIVLPGVGKTKAKLVQKELLSRARKHVTPN